MLRNILRVLTLLSSGNFKVSSLFSSFFSISAFEIVASIHSILAENSKDKFNTVIDIGANKGQFLYACKTYFPDCSVYCFEPDPGAYNALSANAGKYSNVKVFPFGLGNKDEDVTFYQNEFSPASSVLPVSELQTRYYPKTSSVRKIEIEIKKFSSIINEININPSALLKIDVQGYEKEVLEGMEDYLKLFDFILIEVSFVEMYKGEAGFDWIHNYLKSRSFNLLSPVAMLRTNNLRILQMDMLYRKIEN